MKLFETIFSVKNENNYKVWNIMGLKFKYKNKNILLSNKLDDLNKNFKQLESKITISSRLANNVRKMGNEHIILPNDYYPYFDSHSIKDDYLNLIKGLDDESILNVQKALARVQQIKNTHYEYFYLTNQEMAEFADYRANFQKAIVSDCKLTKDDEVLEIGYLFNKNYWHKGFATEAAIACKNYAFNVLNADRVYSIIRDNNIASQKVAIRNGMKIIDNTVKHYYNMDMPHYIFCVENI